MAERIAATEEQFQRTAMLIGEEAVAKLHNSRVAVFGVGGVGGYVVEALARAGVGHLDLIDNDDVAISNINRQIVATYDSVGRSKVEVAKERVLSLNPNCKVETYERFYLPGEEEHFSFDEYDYIVDAIDTVSGKIGLVMVANEKKIPIISAMGAGNKTDASKFQVTDIYKTSVCPLAKVMRRELKKRGIRRLKVVYSTQEAATPLFQPEDVGGSRRQTPASVCWVVATAGMLVAGEVVNDLIK